MKKADQVHPEECEWAFYDGAGKTARVRVSSPQLIHLVVGVKIGIEMGYTSTALSVQQRAVCTCALPLTHSFCR